MTLLHLLFLDGSSWVSTEYLGQEYVEICHGNICQTTLSWIFVAAFDDAQLQGYYIQVGSKMNSWLAGLVFAIQKDHSNIAQSICVSP